MRTHSKVAELFLHTMGRTTYSSHGGPELQATHDSPAKQLEDGLVRDVEVVRVLGTADNAALIMALHNYRLQHGLPTIKVGSPSLCRLNTSRPGDVLRQMQSEQLGYAPSVGGWHQLTPADYCSYALAHATHNAAGQYTEEMERQLLAHPAYRPLSFIPTLDKAWACQLLTEWLDPRFHVDPDEPDDLKALNRHMGLGRGSGVRCIKKILADNVNPQAESADLFWRAFVTYKTWSRGWVDLHAQDEIEPANFLMKVVQRVSADKEIAVALVRASYVFLRYMKLTWLDALNPEREHFRTQRRKLGKEQATKVVRTLQTRKTYSPTLFIPEHFFTDINESAAWRAHTFGGCKKGN